MLNGISQNMWMHVSDRLRVGPGRSPVAALQWYLERRQREKEGRSSRVKRTAQLQQMPNSLWARTGRTRTSCALHTAVRNTTTLQACVTLVSLITQRNFSWSPDSQITIKYSKEKQKSRSKVSFLKNYFLLFKINFSANQLNISNLVIFVDWGISLK